MSQYSSHSGKVTSRHINGDLLPLKAEYRQLGRSGLRVSVPILGAMSIGDRQWADWVIEEKEVSDGATYDCIL